MTTASRRLGLLAAITLGSCVVASPAPAPTGTAAAPAPAPAAAAPAEPAAAAPAEPAAAPAATGSPEDCTAICQNARSSQATACVEGKYEELGFEMDSKSCNDWEGAAITGMGGDPCALFTACKAEQGFSDAHCATVKNSCL